MRQIKLNQHTALRAKSLGALGELLAIKALVDNGFNNIKNLNDNKRNFPYADLYAERENEKYVISVKARNRYERTGRLNSRYNLGSNCIIKAKKAELQFNAKAAWLAISIFDDIYSIYFGTLESLTAKTGIPIGATHFQLYECLVKEKQHGLDFRPYKNIYEKGADQSGQPDVGEQSCANRA
ncbi:hypothetical protein [uncultured Desulfobulbus sp.]|uniref:hypothetical protein n=1 Tax=uncultured Desulfobulbus sp. TaxID=239745 RepID=UPI0029C97E63|nr:hypothetical protein [uncultured Desulfobulbus sp.]